MSAILKEGVLEFQKKGNLGKKKWKIVYTVITAGGFHVYQDANVRNLFNIYGPLDF
jgi:hypothetical protein